MRFAIIAFVIVQSYGAAVIAGLNSGNDQTYMEILYASTAVAYGVIVGSIKLFHNQGLEVFEDKLSLWMIAASCLIRAHLGMSGEAPYRVLLALLGLILVWHILRRGSALRWPEAPLVWRALGWSIGFTVAAAALRVAIDPRPSIAPEDWVRYALAALAYHFSFVAVVEEAYFRGLIYSLLRGNGYSENRALMTQAVFFWGMHFITRTDPIVLFVMVPLYTAFATLAIKYYRSLFVTIMVHTINNAFGGLLTTLL